MNIKKSYPSYINNKFKKRKVDSAFISSIASRNEKYLDFGIVAKWSIICVIDTRKTTDRFSITNFKCSFAKVLDLKGRVIIEIKALKFYHENPNIFKIDLAKQWQDKIQFTFCICSFMF